MRGLPEGFWGKFQEGYPPEWHPLADHSVDVACCFEALLGLAGIRSRLARLGGLGNLTEQQVQRLAVLVLLHDLGKLNLGFQLKVFPPGKRPRHLPSAGHIEEALVLLGDIELSPRAALVLHAGEMENWTPVPETVHALLLASISHHGRPVTLGGDHGLKTRLWKPNQGWDPFQGLADLTEVSRRGLSEAFQPGGDLLPAQPAFQHGFAGLVTLADWLGSNRAWFPYSAQEGPDRWEFAREQARRALRAVGLDVSEPRRHIASYTPSYIRVFSIKSPHPMQVAAESLPLPAASSVTILESETGSGKTEAAIFHYLRLMRAGVVDGLYFALPTRTAATQICERVSKAVQRTFGSAAPPVVQAVPGYVRVDGEKPESLLPRGDNLLDDMDAERFAYRSWAGENSKRFLAAAVAVGTIDQALMATLRVKHAHLRLASLTRSLLVVDEVHASDPYMTVLLRTLLQAHRDAGGHALLMSATLGSASRCAYLDVPMPSLAHAISEPYPALWLREGERVEPPQPFKSPRTKSVSMAVLPAFDHPAAVASQALAAARRGARVLVLRNTVGGAVDTQRALEHLTGPDDPLLFRCEGRITLHHARFAREDRQLLDGEIERRFGKDSPPKAGIVVSTQTIEQSLDVDFDLLLTDLCPVDVLLQRIGRLHRHQRNRPEGFGNPACILLTPAERDLAPMLAKGRGGLGSIYPDLRIIEATWRLIEHYPAWTIPAMNRSLVERATHPEPLNAIAAELGAAWQTHAADVQGETMFKGQLARLNALDRTKPFGDPRIGFPTSLDEKIATRLGTYDRLAEFPKGEPGPFGRVFHSFRIPGHLCRGASEPVPFDVCPVVTERNAEGSQFTFGPYRFAYDRHGLRRVED